MSSGYLSYGNVMIHVSVCASKGLTMMWITWVNSAIASPVLPFTLVRVCDQRSTKGNENPVVTREHAMWLLREENKSDQWEP